MKNKISINIIILISTLFMASCSEKFPTSISDSTGILAIGMEGSNKTKSTNYVYNYLLNYSPETPVKINITPKSGEKFVLINDFPVGKYWIKTYNSIGKTVNCDTRGLSKPRIISIYLPFEIKKNCVTLLNAKLIVNRFESASGRDSQTLRFKKLDNESRKHLVEKLHTLENSELYKFD